MEAIYDAKLDPEFQNAFIDIDKQDSRKLPDGTESDLKFDYGFVCLGMRANAPILQALYDTFGNSGDVEIMNIGDSVRARRIIEGTTEGRNILGVLEQREYL